MSDDKPKAVEVVESQPKTPADTPLTMILKDNQTISAGSELVNSPDNNGMDNNGIKESERNLKPLNSEENVMNSRDENGGQMPKAEDIIEGSPPKASVIGSAFTMTNMCLGTTIFTFAYRTQSMGLLWINVACVVCAAANLWTIYRQLEGAKDLKVCDFSEVVNELFGAKVCLGLNVMIIIYEYGVLISFVTIIFKLIGRFICSLFYHNVYDSFDDFADEKWEKAYVKYPVYLGLAALLFCVCVLRDMSKLNFMSYVSVASVLYTIVLVVVQCPSYYKHYKDTVYIKEDDSTHINVVNIGKAFTYKLEFFKNMSSLFFAYSCQVGIFPVYKTFKKQQNGLSDMRKSVFFSLIMTTLLHIVSITTCYLTDPITPEDLIIYRRKKDGGYDIPMDIAKLAVAISIFFSVPPNYLALRLSVENTFLHRQFSTLGNCVFTGISMVCGCLVAAVYDKILNYISYLGGFFCSLLSFLFPVLFYICFNGKPMSYWMNALELTGSIVLISVGWMAGILTIVDDIRGD